MAALTRWDSHDPPQRKVDAPQARTVGRAMEEAGIRPSRRARRVRDFQLDTLLFDGPAYQDWAATHVRLPDDHARVRIYTVETGASPEYLGVAPCGRGDRLHLML